MDMLSLKKGNIDVIYFHVNSRINFFLPGVEPCGWIEWFGGSRFYNAPSRGSAADQTVLVIQENLHVSNEREAPRQDVQ